jgi:hypothetical protein
VDEAIKIANRCIGERPSPPPRGISGDVIGGETMKRRGGDAGRKKKERGKLKNYKVIAKQVKGSN